MPLEMSECCLSGLLHGHVGATCEWPSRKSIHLREDKTFALETTDLDEVIMYLKRNSLVRLLLVPENLTGIGNAVSPVLFLLL